MDFRSRRSRCDHARSRRSSSVIHRLHEPLSRLLIAKDAVEAGTLVKHERHVPFLAVPLAGLVPPLPAATPWPARFQHFCFLSLEHYRGGSLTLQFDPGSQRWTEPAQCQLRNRQTFQSFSSTAAVLFTA